jgi:hypothetical protein
MAAVKTIHPTVGVQFHVNDAAGNHVTVQQTPPAPVLGTRNLTVSIGGTTFVFSANTINDLLPVMTGFVAVGALT